MSDKIFCQVSVGEIFDKITILEIKSENIVDENKIKEIKKEYDLLISEFSIKENYHYKILKKINLDIWFSMDKLRDLKEIDSIWIVECKKTLKDNDRRFRVKQKINNIENSNIKEQKSYDLTTAFILTHFELEYGLAAIGMVRYLSTCYDRVIFVCATINENNFKFIYSDDKNIEIYPVGDFKSISPMLGFDQNKFDEITKGMDLYLCETDDKKFDNVKLFSFYEDVNIDVSIFWEYFYINPDQNFNLYKLLENKKYAFIHNMNSNKQVFDIKDVEYKLNINRDSVLIINPSYNIYNIDHEFYHIAQFYINHPICYYLYIIINADYLILSDSSFFSLAINLEIKTDNCYYISKDDYSCIYNDNYCFNSNLKRKKFRKLLLNN
jgi:hypothetical protein